MAHTGICVKSFTKAKSTKPQIKLSYFLYVHNASTCVVLLRKRLWPWCKILGTTCVVLLRKRLWPWCKILGTTCVVLLRKRLWPWCKILGTTRFWASSIVRHFRGNDCQCATHGILWNISWYTYIIKHAGVQLRTKVSLYLLYIRFNFLTTAITKILAQIQRIR
jgi:hypothetical protein